MALMFGDDPGSPAARAQLSAADKRATALTAAGMCLSAAAIFGLPGPNAFFMGIAPAVGLLTGAAALIGIFMRRYRAGWARLLLLAGAAVLAIAGIAYAGNGHAARTVLAYFLPAALFLAAAGTLHAPRVQQQRAT